MWAGIAAMSAILPFTEDMQYRVRKRIVGNIAGVHVTSGVVKNNSECKLIRDGVIITTTKIKSLQREKDNQLLQTTLWDSHL